MTELTIEPMTDIYRALAIANRLRDADKRIKDHTRFMHSPLDITRQAMSANAWLCEAANTTIAQGLDEAIFNSFRYILTHILATNDAGACHSSSAALHVVLSEIGIQNDLCIGIVDTRRNHFDHSWIEVNGLIVDAAICLPLPGGAEVAGPVYASVDLDDGKPTKLQYGVGSLGKLDYPADMVAKATLESYAKMQLEHSSYATCWELACGLLLAMEFKTSPGVLYQKYKHVTRKVYGDVL